jgi:hypothetical protein
MRLQVPPSDVQRFLDFMALKSEDRQRLIDAIAEATSCLMPEQLARKVASSVGQSEDRVEGPIMVMLSLYRSRLALDSSIPEFIAGVRETGESVRAIKKDNRTVDWDSLQEHLRRILEMHESLGVSAKAAELASEHTNVFLKARVLTDVRAVFQPDPQVHPRAALILHNLRVSYIHDGDEKNIYLAMDKADIMTLENELKRALAKEASLRDALARSIKCWLGDSYDEVAGA